MAIESWYFKYYLVVFLDVLGQRESLRKITAIPKNEEDKKKFIELIKASIVKVDSIRTSFKNFFNASITPNTELVKPELREQFVAARKTEIYFYNLSDAVVIAVPFMNDDEHCTAMNGVLSAFIATCGMGLLGLSEEIPVRAGLDVGIATQIDDNEIYGPALASAVYLEGRLAEYPRFLIGEELMVYLTTIETQEAKTPFGLIAKKTAENCKQMIVQDSDGRFMLDFLGTKFKEITDKAITKEVVLEAKEYVVKQYKKHKIDANEKLSSRYVRLMHYFYSRRDVWGIE
jgi:hypothetical protein